MKSMGGNILIVGAGLAGICLARRLHERGEEFEVIDQGVNAGSRVAAGILNPLVFRRMTKSWRVDELLPAAADFYTGLSLEWGNRYYETIPIRRAFAHAQEHDLWIEKQDQPEFSPYMKQLSAEDERNSAVKNTFGTGMVLQSAFVRTGPFLDDAHQWLQSENRFRKEKLDYALLDPETGKYRGKTYEKIVFCEGYEGVYNPWFGYLPLQTTKGEILTIRSEELSEAELLNRKCFILPLGDHHFRLGATYAWNSPDTALTEKAREELTAHAESLTDAQFTVVKQEAGVRPTVPDRRPLLGNHPEYARLYIFNGLGTKGYMTAPLLSKELTASLFEERELGPDTDIRRYQSFYERL